MLKILDRSIALQLLIFYCFFLLPLILGGVELYLFQRGVLEQDAQSTTATIAQATALEVEGDIRAAVAETVDLSRSQAASRLDLRQLTANFAIANLSHPEIDQYFVCDTTGTLLLSYTTDQANTLSHTHPCEYSPTFLKNDTVLISAGRFSPTTHSDIVSLVTQIMTPQRQVIGLLGLNITLAYLNARLLVIQQRLERDGEIHIWVVDQDGQALANTDHAPLQTDLHHSLPVLKNALQGQQGNLLAQVQNREWLFSYVPVAGTAWAIVIQRPADGLFAAIVSFQNSLLITLLTLIVGASFFWFVMHGWVVAPLSKLAQAAKLIKPDRTEKISEGKLLARERGRIDEIGNLVAAFSAMEEEIHALFRKSDEKSQARLSTLDAIMRSMDEGVLMEDPDGHIMYANYSFTQTIGLLPQEISSDSLDSQKIEEKLLALIEDTDAYHEANQKVDRIYDPQGVDFQIRGSYNEVGQFIPGRRDIRIRMFEVRDQVGQLIGRGKIFRDVTRQNQAEQVKKNLLAIVSHELRTPLTAIKGYTTSLLATDIELSETLKERYLRRIVEESDHMAALVTSLLEMSQLEAGTLKLTPALYHLNTLVEHAIAGEEKKFIHAEIPENLPPVYVDYQRIEVVLRNILENARRYAGAEALIDISARYEQEQAIPGLYISIADNGPGLPPDLTERIFDRFYQIDGGRKRSSSGVGLGLAICRGFIEAHGGRIWAENRTDGQTGAVFHIWLPPKLLYTADPQSNGFTLQDAL